MIASWIRPPHHRRAFVLASYFSQDFGLAVAVHKWQPRLQLYPDLFENGCRRSAG
jgi:hypothetical protein